MPNNPHYNKISAHLAWSKGSHSVDYQILWIDLYIIHHIYPICQDAFSIFEALQLMNIENYNLFDNIFGI